MCPLTRCAVCFVLVADATKIDTETRRREQRRVRSPRDGDARAARQRHPALVRDEEEVQQRRARGFDARGGFGVFVRKRDAGRRRSVDVGFPFFFPKRVPSQDAVVPEDAEPRFLSRVVVVRDAGEARRARREAPRLGPHALHRDARGGRARRVVGCVRKKKLRRVERRRGRRFGARVFGVELVRLDRPRERRVRGVTALGRRRRDAPQRVRLARRVVRQEIQRVRGRPRDALRGRGRRGRVFENISVGVGAEDARHGRRLVQRMPQREDASPGAHEQSERARREVPERVARQRRGPRLATRRVREERPAEPNAQRRRVRRAAEPIERFRLRRRRLVDVGRGVGTGFGTGIGIGIGIGDVSRIVRIVAATRGERARTNVVVVDANESRESRRSPPRAPSLARREGRRLLREGAPRDLLGSFLERRPEPHDPAARPDETRVVHVHLLVVVHGQGVFGARAREHERPRRGTRVVPRLDGRRAAQRQPTRRTTRFRFVFAARVRFRVCLARRGSRASRKKRLVPDRLLVFFLFLALRHRLLLLVHRHEVVHREQVVGHGVPVGRQSAEQQARRGAGAARLSRRRAGRVRGRTRHSGHAVHRVVRGERRRDVRHFCLPGRLSSFVVLRAQQRLARGDKGVCAKAPRRHGSRPGVRAASESEPAPMRRVLDGQAWFMS